MKISDYNYKTAKELSNAIKNEKKKNREEKIIDSCLIKVK